MQRFREITTADVGRWLFEAFDRKWPVSNFIGRILPGDVGKRVYQVGDILQVENDEQRAARLAKTEDLVVTEDREPGVDFDVPFTFVTLNYQGYAVEVFCGRLREAEKLLDEKAVAGVQAVYLYGPSGFVNSVKV